MIQIKDSANLDLNKIANEHFATVEKYLLKKIQKIQRPQWLKDFLLLSLPDIITGRPKDLNKLHKNYKAAVKQNGAQLEKIDKRLGAIFNYNWFSSKKEKAYELANLLQINCCPYCNRNYTVTVIETKSNKMIVRPDFDHFFPKSKYPLFSLSFFNLIPSCPLCNRSIKGAKETAFGKNLHPYEDGYGKALLINYKANDIDSMLGLKRNLEIKVILNATERVKAKMCGNNFELFKLKEIYQTSHLDEIQDIIKKFHVSGGRYLEVLHEQFKGIGTLQELYKLAFAGYYLEDEFGNRPLSKLTKDIFDQLSFATPFIP